MPAYPPDANPPGPPASPPPPMWMPTSQAMVPPGMRPVNWGLLGFLAKAIGFLLVFVGTLIAVIVLAPTTTPNINNMDGGALAAHILWVIGLAAIGAGAGIKMRYVYVQTTSDLSDGQSRVLVANQARNTLTFVVVLVLLVVLLTLASTI